MTANDLTPRRSSRAWAALLGMVLGLSLVAPVSATAPRHQARMSSELSAKLNRSDAELLRVVLTAPQAEVDRLAKKYGVAVLRRLFSGAVFIGTPAQFETLAADRNVFSLEEDLRVFSTMAVTTQSTARHLAA
jgi:hypothetical protein